MEQAPNVFVITFAETTITFGWNIPGDTPNALKILRVSPNPVVFGEFTQNDAGFFSSQFQDTGLQPGTLFTYQVCCEYSDQILCGTVAQRTSGSPTPAAPTITITKAQAFPALLVKEGNKWRPKSNGISISWAASTPIIGINVEMISGIQQHGINVGGDGANGTSGSIFVNPPKPGLTYEVTIKGQLPEVPPILTFTDSSSVQVVDPDNFHSLRAFLSDSGIDPSQGIRNLLITFPVSFRSMMGI
jgi:hypothetical protein